MFLSNVLLGLAYILRLTLFVRGAPLAHTSFQATCPPPQRRDIVLKPPS